MAADYLLPLRSERFEVLLAPAIGGSIARFDHVGAGGVRTPILRGTDDLAGNVLNAACFPLVPYCNRIRGGRFNFRGRDVTIAPNAATDAMPLHGDGWLAPWSIERSADGEAELVFRNTPREWPWGYEARQRFSLDGDGLTVRLSCRNLSREAMPCGLGQHPYWPCTPETRLDTRVENVWTVDEAVLPVDKLPATGRYALRDRLVWRQDLDNGYDGWDGEARFHTPGLPIDTRLSSPDGRFFQLYSPLEGDFVVAEPVTHANAALNEPEEKWASLGLRILGPGEEMSLEARFDAIEVG